MGLENTQYFNNSLTLHIVRVIFNASEYGNRLAGFRVLEESHCQTTAASTISEHTAELLWATQQVYLQFRDTK